MRTIKQETCNPLGISLRAELPDAGGRTSIRPVSALERWLLKEMLRTLGDPPVALVAWDSTVVNPAGRGEALIRLHLHDPGALLRLALDRGFLHAHQPALPYIPAAQA